MIDYLQNIDNNIVLYINEHNSIFLDNIMWIISSKLIWIPLYLFFLFLIYKNYKKDVFKILIIFGLTILLSDFTSSGIIKKSVKRYRPSHNKEISSKLNYHRNSDNSEYRGGDYGFVSSHSANSMAVAIILIFLFRKKNRYIWLLLIWAMIISYSRIYLGVHYLSDVLGGMFVGFCSASLVIFLFKKIKYLNFSELQLER